MTVASSSVSAPHATAMKEVQQAGIGSGYGTTNTSVTVDLKWPGNKRAKLTKITLADLYEAGGTALSPAAVGLKEISAMFVVGSPTTNVKPDNSATAAANAVPTLTTASGDGATTSAPKIKLLVHGTDVVATTDVTGTVFHAILVGI